MKLIVIIKKASLKKLSQLFTFNPSNIFCLHPFGLNTLGDRISPVKIREYPRIYQKTKSVIPSFSNLFVQWDESLRFIQFYSR